MSLFRVIVAMLSLIVLSACGPIYNTEYAYEPPKNATGKMCIAQCVQAKTHCEQLCALREDNCRMQKRQQAEYDYREYKRERHHEGREVKKEVRDFDKSYQCNHQCGCGPAFNTCYSACGGHVQEQKRCVAFCDKQA